jgi:hypothetical protein
MKIIRKPKRAKQWSLYIRHDTGDPLEAGWIISIPYFYLIF